MSHSHFQIDHSLTSFEDIQLLMHENSQISVSENAQQSISKCRNYLDEKLKNSDQLYYGINTGFGFLQNVKIDNDQLEQLQINLVRSHACGMGEKVPADIVKLMLALKIKSLSFGHSGVQLATVNRLCELYNNNVLPIIYTQGSLGASGDLAPLSHMSLPLIGEGKVSVGGQEKETAEIMTGYHWAPISLKSKEGLALINGTQFMSAYGLHCLVRAKKLLQWANRIAALSFDAFDCITSPLHEAVHAIRPHKGQVDTASIIRGLLAGSEIANGIKPQVQDPYSFRCIPQVHGASADSMDYVISVFIKEINSVTDNPNIFPDQDLILSAGNFHGQPLALSLDFLSIALSELGSISERRTYQLISGQRGLPAFLVKNSGLNSGFMIPQYTAAGIVSENKQLCTPASVDSIPSSNNQEDHVSMGANAATKCKRVVDNLEKILAIELLTAAQAIEFRKPLKTSVALQEILDAFRQQVSFNDADRILHEDMMAAVEFLRTHL